MSAVLSSCGLYRPRPDREVQAGLRCYFDFTLEFLRAQGKPLMCFGRTAGGDPLHTLTLGYDTQLVPL